MLYTDSKEQRVTSQKQYQKLVSIFYLSMKNILLLSAEKYGVAFLPSNKRPFI
jgi:hypothetical protein